MASNGTSIPPVAIVVSRYNAGVTSALLDGAVEAYERRGGSRETLAIVEAPGAFELPQIAGVVAGTGRYQAVVCLGCVVRGETTHDEHIARAIAHGLTELSLQRGLPVAFGVVTALDAGQALARAGGGKGNKGDEAMSAALDAWRVMDAVRSSTQIGMEYRLPGVRADKTANPEEGA